MKNNTSQDRQAIVTDQERRRLFLRYVNRGWLIFGVVTLVAMPIFPEERSVFAYVAAIIFPTYLIVRFLNLSGRTRPAGVVFTIAVNFGLYGLFLVLVHDLGAEEAFRTQATVWLLMGLGVLFAGALVDKWAAPLMALFNTVLLIGTRLTLAPESDPRPSAVVFWWMMGLIVWLYESTLQQAFGRAWSELAERQRAHEQLRKLSSAVEHSPASIVITDPGGNIEYVNPRFTDITGHTMAEAVGKSPRILKSGLTPKDEYVRLWDTIKAGEEWRGEFCNRKKNGELYWVSASISPITDEAGHITHFVAVNEDITERKQAEAELRASEARLQAAIDAADIGLWDWDLVSGQITWLGHHDKLFGAAPGEFDGTYPAFERRIHPEDLEEMNKVIQRAREKGTEYAHEYRVIWPDGSTHWIDGRGRFVYSEAGQPVRMYGAVLNITERKRAEEELRLSEARYRAVVEHQTEFIVRWKPDGTRTFANEAYRRYFGLTPEQTVSAGFMPLVAEEDRTAVQAKVSRLVSGEAPSEMDVHRVIKPDGGTGWQEWVDQAIHDETGQIVEFQSVGRDITERKRIETALQESEKRYRDLVEFSPVAITVHAEGRIVYINPAGAKLWGADKPDEVLGRSPLDFVHPEYHERITERIRQIQAVEQSPPPIEVKNIQLDGQILYTVGTGIPITYEGKPAILSVVLDITERKRAEERMRELTRRLIAAQEEERKRIAQELHDELGQALTAISLDLGGIEKALPPEAPLEIRERLIDARSLADEADERISELALDLRPSLLDDLGLLPTLQWYLNRYSLRLGIEVALEIKGLESRLPEEVETTLYRVIQEALTNIARHAGAGAVRLSLERSAAAVTASIQDDGRGFDVEEAQSPAASPGGVGLLGIKDRVSTLGGRVEIHSNPGQGVRLQIEIPL